MDPTNLISLGAAALGGVVWGVRLEGRVNTAEALADSKDKNITDRLARIEEKVDHLLEKKFGG